MIRGLIRRLLSWTPGWFRERYGDELLRVHEARAATRGSVRGVIFTLGEVVGMLALLVRLRLGGRRRYEDGTRGGGTMIEGRLNDARSAFRALRRNPGFTLTAVAVLALGIGANTAIFGAANAFFFRPLPFRDPDRLVLLYETNPEFGWKHASAAPSNVVDWRERVAAFQDVAMYSDVTNRVTWVRDGEPMLLNLSLVSGNFFSVLGVPAEVGRTFRWEETWDGRDDVVVLSHAFWQSVFGGDPDVVGRTLDFGPATVEVVGVAPEGFTFPGGDVQMWSPWGWPESALREVSFRRAHFVRPVARLEPGVTLEEADAQLQIVVSRLQEAYPETNSVMGAGFEPMRDFLVREVRTPVLTLVAAVALLLLLACVNVANLALVRAGERRREIALRRALGAARGRIAELVLAESALVAGLGGAAGLGLGWLGLRSMAGMTSLGIRGATGIALDHRVVLFTLAVTVVSGLLFGLAPVVRSTATDVVADLKAGAGRGGEGLETLRASRLLVAAEVALALLLAVGAGLMVRTSAGLRAVDPGFRTRGVLAVRFTIPSSRYPSRDEVLSFYDRFLEALEGRPGVRRAGTVGGLPLTGRSWSSQFQARGWPADRVGFEILHRRADRGYFEALGIPLLRGRMFGPGDGPDDPPVVLVNETFAREHFPNEDPVGQRIAYDREAGPRSTWREIIGIVGDQNQESPGIPARAEVFEDRNQDWARDNWVVLRTGQDPMSVVPAIRQVLHEMDPLIPLSSVRPLRQVWRASMAREDLVLTLLGVFGVLALVLAAVGVYGVTAQAARKRTREIGVRMALGAAGGDVVRLMLGQGLRGVVAGLVVGVGAALLATRALGSLLFGVEPDDPVTFGAVAGLLLAVAVVASWIPARRAVGLDPVDSLRAE